MVCSVCNKNTADIFINKIENGKQVTEGLCYNCAKERGLNPLEILAKQANLSEENLQDMAKQFEDIFQDVTNNVDMENLENNPNGEQNIPIGAIITNMFSSDKNKSDKSEKSNDPNKKKTKVEKKPKEEKKRFIDTYGTNLTQKARNHELDTVVGRDK